jgi:hypothetical protein
MDDRKRIAMVESRSVGNGDSPTRLVRYQYSNKLRSACLELDGDANMVSYEEYYSSGWTLYQATSNVAEVPKRWRYIGKTGGPATTPPGSVDGFLPIQAVSLAGQISTFMRL